MEIFESVPIVTIYLNNVLAHLLSQQSDDLQRFYSEQLYHSDKQLLARAAVISVYRQRHYSRRIITVNL